jgi:hypothetical protein
MGLCENNDEHPNLHKNWKLTFMPVDFYVLYVFFECGLLACDVVKVDRYVFPRVCAIYRINAVMLPKTLALMPHAVSTAI